MINYGLTAGTILGQHKSKGILPKGELRWGAHLPYVGLEPVGG